MLVETDTQVLRFLDTLVTVHARHDQGLDGVSILEVHAPFGDSPPLHVHHGEDETFFVLDGELRVRLGDEELRLPAGACARTPKGLPHTYRVESEQGARWLVVTSQGDFERFVLSLAGPAEEGAVPALSGPPSDEQQRELATAAAAHGIDLLGPPLS